MLKLYDGTTSVCAIKARLVLFEKSIPFESETLDLRAGDQFDPAYLALNPNAVVPTLDDDGAIIVESSVIMQYLEDTHPEPSLLPENPVDRAAMRIWLKRVDDVIHPSTGTLTHATVYRPGFLALSAEDQAARLEKMPDENRRQRFAAVYKDGLDAPIVINAVHALNRLVLDMQKVLETSDFLAGNAYSLADAAVTPYANRLFDLGLLGLWAMEAPRVFNWFSAIRERASFEPAIVDYLTEADQAAFRAMEPEVPMQIKTILDEAWPVRSSSARHREYHVIRPVVAERVDQKECRQADIQQERIPIGHIEPPGDQEQSGDHQPRFEQHRVNDTDTDPAPGHAAMLAVPQVEHPVEGQVPAHREDTEHQAERAHDFHRPVEQPATRHRHQKQGDRLEYQGMAQPVGETAHGSAS
ncbi:MAG: glutathione S-transferase family protein [Rhodospirillaceae bacterium]|nr:glutathione S-transferase family protein [Rhodospirillaceae bacterium]